MILSVFSSYPIPPRLIKISSLYGLDIRYISWNRKNYSLKKNGSICETVFDDSKSGKLLQYFDILKFRASIRSAVKREAPEVLICRNWKTFFIVRTIKTPGVKIVYDVCDVPNNKMIRRIEKHLINKNTEVILASRFFNEYYEKFNCKVYENRISDMERIEKKPGEKMRISFLGVVRYPDTLLNLIKACDGLDGLELSIWGYGNSVHEIKEYIDTHACKVALKGEYAEKDIPRIYSEADLIWCAYPYELDNVKIAISNKFFETIAFHTPGIFSINTKLGELVEEKNIGFTVDPYSADEIKKLIETILKNRDLLEDRAKAMDKCGENVYWKDYTRQVNQA